jgi:hypothetical protein
MRMATAYQRKLSGNLPPVAVAVVINGRVLLLKASWHPTPITGSLVTAIKTDMKILLP